MTTKHETMSNIVQAIPATTLVGVQVFGLSLPDWAAIVGIAFVCLQAVYLLWRWHKEAKK
jgi:hypothetical protein